MTIFSQHHIITNISHCHIVTYLFQRRHATLITFTKVAFQHAFSNVTLCIFVCIFQRQFVHLIIFPNVAFCRAFSNVTMWRVFLSCIFQRLICAFSNVSFVHFSTSHLCIFQRLICAFSNVTMYNNVFMCYVRKNYII